MSGNLDESAAKNAARSRKQKGRGAHFGAGMADDLVPAQFLAANWHPALGIAGARRQTLGGTMIRLLFKAVIIWGVAAVVGSLLLGAMFGAFRAPRVRP